MIDELIQVHIAQLHVYEIDGAVKPIVFQNRDKVVMLAMTQFVDCRCLVLDILAGNSLSKGAYYLPSKNLRLVWIQVMWVPEKILHLASGRQTMPKWGVPRELRQISRMRSIGDARYMAETP